MSLYSIAIRSLALPWVSVLTESNFWQLFRGYAQRPETLFSPAPAETLERMRELLTHAHRYVPYYRELLDGAGIGPDEIRSFDDFRRIPATSKAGIAANFPDRITAESKPFRPWRYVSTSGTIERLTAIHDFRKRDYVRTTQLLALNVASGYQLGMKYLELPPDVCRNVCGAQASVEPSIYRYFYDSLSQRKLRDPEVISDLKGLVETQLVYRRLLLPSQPGNGLVQKPEVLDAYLDQINEYAPFVAKALPAYLYMLALHLEKTGRKAPRIAGGVMPMGGSITAHMKQTVERAFGKAVFEDYGCAELGALGAQVKGETGIRPFAGPVHVEVLCGGRPARVGEMGEVVITDLFSYAMPFIRYRIGDVARVLDDSGRMELLGRVGDCLPGDGGRPVTSDEAADTLLPHPDVLAFQLVYQGAGKVDLQVVPRNGDVRMDQVRDLVHGLLGPAVKVNSRVVPTILAEPGGKFRFVKNQSGQTVM